MSTTTPPTARRSRLVRLMDDTLVAGLVILLAGAVVLLVTSRAQTGFPWQSSYEVTVKVPDAGKLTKAADVRIGGARVGQVLRIRAVPAKGDAPPHAELDLQLRERGPLPRDTTVEVRLASVLGGKYVALVPGRSARTVPEHGRLPLANAKLSVDVDEAFRMFDAEGREGVRKVVGELGGALSGRGTALNETAAVTVRLLPPLQRVLRNLDAVETDLPGFVAGAAAATAALAPLAADLPPLLADGTATLDALDDDALDATLAALPGTATTARRALGRLQPVLADAAALAGDLRPAARELGPATGRLSRTMRTAIRVNPEIASLAAPLDRTLKSVATLTSNPASSGALRLLGSTDLATFGASAFVGLGAILEATWEAERSCRTATAWAQGLSSAMSDGDAGGNWLRMIPIFRLGEMLPAKGPVDGLHFNPYPVQNGTECEAGNEPVGSQTRIGNVPGLQGRVEAP